MDLTRKFNEITKDDAETAGGKGASLGEMTKAGIPVPEGYVILASTFDAFLAEADLLQEIEAILAGVNHEAIHTVDLASERIQELILTAKMPEAIQKEIESEFALLGAQYVAVRSSATAEDGAEHAWAGQLDSYLNTTEKELLKNVQRCWASLFTPRAIFYRFEKGLNTTHISVAVVVQKMVNSEVSGIAFSVHPVTEDRNQLIIEAGFGLGEAIVSGSVTPDSYVVTKEPREIIDVNVSEQNRALYRVAEGGEPGRAKGGGNEWRDLASEVANSQVLSEPQILELSEIILRIEQHYGFPCDIEWAFEGGKFYIVQSRPITTLSDTETSVKKTENLSITDFKLTFSAQGHGVLFEEMIAKYYLPKTGTKLITCDDNLLQVFVSNETVATLNKEGESLVEQATNVIDSLKGTTTRVLAETKTIKGVKQIDVSLLDVVYQNLAEVMHNYACIDTWYTDGLYENGKVKDQALSAVEAIEAFKNDIRAGDIEKVFFDADGYLQTFLQKISTQTLVPMSDFFHYTYLDFVALISSDTRVSETVLADRSIAYALTIAGEDVFLLAGQNAKKYIAEFKRVENPEAEEHISGTVAYGTGTVSGRARVLITNADLSVQEASTEIEDAKGLILIIPTADARIDSVYSHTLAVVTDVGGMLSHAAIVAREFKIPCIVGTKRGTEIIKDGDLVEVDADNGVVRILEKVASAVRKV